MTGIAPAPDWADHQAIADLVHGYARAIREARPQAGTALFTDDGVFEVRERNPHNPASERLLQRLEGREAVGAMIAQSTSGAVRLCPLIHNLMVTTSGDTAEANSIMEGRSWPAGGEFIGEYHDSFRRTPDGWRFSQRSYTLLRLPD